MPLLPQSEVDLVTRDGLPRVVTADDGSQHVVYLDGDVVRSVLASDWAGPLPTPPTQAEIDAAIAAREAQKRQEKEDAAALRQRVRNVAGSAVGQSFDTLTAAQVRSLLAVLLHRAGALDKSGVVRPLDEWAK